MIAPRLPKLKIALVPDVRCCRCGQKGYVEEKSTLCLACLNIGLLRWTKRRLNLAIIRRLVP